MKSLRIKDVRVGDLIVGSGVVWIVISIEHHETGIYSIITHKKTFHDMYKSWSVKVIRNPFKFWTR